MALRPSVRCALRCTDVPTAYNSCEILGGDRLCRNFEQVGKRAWDVRVEIHLATLSKVCRLVASYEKSVNIESLIPEQLRTDVFFTKGITCSSQLFSALRKAPLSP